MTLSEPSFGVLFVCTANHCRSPIAEHLLRRELASRDLDWSVASAGTRAEVLITVDYSVRTPVLAFRGPAPR